MAFIEAPVLALAADYRPRSRLPQPCRR